MKIRLLTLLTIMICFASCSTDEITVNNEETNATELSSKRQDPNQLVSFTIEYTNPFITELEKSEIRNYYFNNWVDWLSYETTRNHLVEIWYADPNIFSIKPSSQGDMEGNPGVNATQN